MNSKEERINQLIHYYQQIKPNEIITRESLFNSAPLWKIAYYPDRTKAVLDWFKSQIAKSNQPTLFGKGI